MKPKILVLAAFLPPPWSPALASTLGPQRLLCEYLAIDSQNPVALCRHGGRNKWRIDEIP